MNHLSLFSGIGGLDLAAEWAGMTTVAFCERDSFCQKVLAKHWPGTPIFDDIHTLTADALSERGIDQIDIVSGGFPCQPFSLAGERRGKEDDRYLWPQMLRIIAECRPSWVVAENVVGLIDLALDDCLASLEGEGYEAWPVVFPACAVGALHIRQRVFILAHPDKRMRQSWIRPCDGEEETRFWDKSKWSEDGVRASLGTETTCGVRGFAEWRRDKPPMGRMAYGIPNRLDRLGALGNAVVPQQAYPIFAAIAAIQQSEQLFTHNHDQNKINQSPT